MRLGARCCSHKLHVKDRLRHFSRTAVRRQQLTERVQPGEVLIYSDDRNVRQDVLATLGPTLRCVELEIREVATQPFPINPPVPAQQVEDLVFVDRGEAALGRR